eukprot:6338567-Lingulodinium_polyedra.AAC.1
MLARRNGRTLSRTPPSSPLALAGKYGWMCSPTSQGQPPGALSRVAPRTGPWDPDCANNVFVVVLAAAARGFAAT